MTLQEFWMIYKVLTLHTTRNDYKPWLTLTSVNNDSGAIHPLALPSGLCWCLRGNAFISIAVSLFKRRPIYGAPQT